MSENKGNTKIEMLKMSQIIAKAENKFGFEATKKQIQAIRKKIQRDLKDNRDRYNNLYPKYSVDKYFELKKTRDYFTKKYKANIKGKYITDEELINKEISKTNEEYELEASAGFVKIEKSINSLTGKEELTVWGLTDDGAEYYENPEMYLSPEEMKYLGKKGGLVRREELTDDEEMYLNTMLSIKEQKNEMGKIIDDKFHETKKDLMLEALFNYFFIFDNDSLQEDITTIAFCGEMEYVTNEIEYLRARERIKDYRNYCRKRKKESD